ncbi:T9SS type A sorting domain-containing protein [bacterium SCSIO 12643]|nr:T9SS type A sorting domain-containing protein [bacterium SCSIO 12643]
MTKNILVTVWFSILSVLAIHAQTSNDIGVQGIQPVSLCVGNTDTIYAEVSNYGINPIDSFMVFWEINLVLDSMWVYQPLDTIGGTGSITEQIALTTVTVPSNNIVMVVWTKWPNGNVDNDMTNDTNAIVIHTILPVDLNDSTHYCENDSVVLDAGLYDSYVWSNGDTTPSIQVADTGYYTVTVTDQQCISSDSIWVESVLDPIAFFHDSSSLFAVAFLNLSQHADSFYWDFGDGTHSTDKDPVHIYPWTNEDTICHNTILVASNVCSSDTFGQITIVGSYGSSNWYSGIKSSINNWQVDFSYSRSATEFYWEFGDGQTSTQANPIHIYSPNGAYECYTVQVRALTHCGYDYVRKRIAVGNYPANNPCQIVTDVPHVVLETSVVSVYPNPAHDILHIDLVTGYNQNSIFELYDVLGKQVLRAHLINGVNSISISHLPTGVYTYRLGTVRGMVVLE